VLHLVLVALVVVDCLRHRRAATSAILWIFIAWSFPLVGPFLYLCIGVDRVPVKQLRKASSNRRLDQSRESMVEASPELAYWRTVHDAIQAEPEQPFAHELSHAMNSILPDHPLLGGNMIDPLVTGDEYFPRLFEAVEAARHHIHLQSFIIANDDVGRQIMDLLAARARAGVQVRLMFDRFGSTRAVLSGMFRRYSGIPNLHIMGWTQANPLKRQFQINLRNHRKIIIIDGMRAFCGGINFARENRCSKTHPAVRDYHFDIHGPVVRELQYTFMRDWYFMTREDPGSLFNESYYPPVTMEGSVMMRLINSEPTGRTGALGEAMFMSMVDARSQIIAVTPYFVPTPDIQRALRAAALRGVQTRIIVPRRNNHVYAGLAGRSLYEELLDAGVRIYERNPPFMHAKALLVDDTFALVGTANMDIRSLRLNYETCLAVYNDVFANRMKEIILEDQAESREIYLHEWRRRPMRQQMIENFAALLSPVL
jgi:cardiolipin synthase